MLELASQASTLAERLAPRPRVWIRVLFYAIFITAVVWIDYITGPTIFFPAWFIPVLLGAWWDGRMAGWIFTIVLVTSRFAMRYWWLGVPWPLSHTLINWVIGITALGMMVELVAHVMDQAKRIKLLEGLLPICSFCHRIRTADGRWLRLESYFEEHTEARFSHTFCPACMEKHYSQKETVHSA